MNTSAEQVKDQKESVCAHCPTGYECGKLKAALTIYGAKIRNQRSPNLKDFARYMAIKLKLLRHRWKYPHAAHACDYENKPREIVKITNRVIKNIERKS